MRAQPPLLLPQQGCKAQAMKRKARLLFMSHAKSCSKKSGKKSVGNYFNCIHIPSSRIFQQRSGSPKEVTEVGGGAAGCNASGSCVGGGVVVGEGAHVAPCLSMKRVSVLSVAILMLLLLLPPPPPPPVLAYIWPTHSALDIMVQLQQRRLQPAPMSRL